MPTYDYVCEACGHEMELFQSMTERPKRKCPKCGDLKLKRLIGTGAGLIFKGSGFYQTDYRSKSYQDAAKAEKGGEGKAEKREGGKDKDTKPATPEKSEKPEKRKGGKKE